MANYNLLEFSDPNKLKSLNEIWEPRKEYIEKDLWVIRNFLSEEELAWLNKEADDPVGWYTTMRSPYGGNVKNKFIGYVPQYDANGAMLPPHPKNNPVFNCEHDIKSIEDRLESVLPKTFTGGGAFQSFFEVSDDKIFAELGHDVDYAMGWHYERDESDSDLDQRIIAKIKNKSDVISEGKITASFSVYTNDNFNGGELCFKNKDYIIKPEPGMLVNVPLYKEFEHKVNKVTNGNRHSLYGRCWDSVKNYHLSSEEDC